jgi:hypothetical protein
MAEPAHWMEKIRQSRLVELMSPFDGLRPRNRLGSLRRLAVMAPAATWAYNLGIVIGHFVQEGGKRLPTARA